MKKFFNTAGPCLADRHYMLPAWARLGQLETLIAQGAYFVLHAPRQSGKTTLLRNLSRELTASGKYAAVTVSVESFFEDSIERMLPQLIGHTERVARQQLPTELHPPPADGSSPHACLGAWLSAWAAALPLPLVVFFDEIDALAGTVLVSVLRQLRDGYCSRPAPFAHSVALVGLRDVRDYRVSVRPEAQTLGSSSPFNIKLRSLTLRNFSEVEVSTLLSQHSEATGQRFEAAALHEVFHQSQGQPWLCNALAAQLVTDFDSLVPERSNAVTQEHVMQARERLIERRDTHLDSLVDKLQDPRVKRVIEPILVGDAGFDASFDDDFLFVSNLGLVRREGGVARIANPIYQEIIPRILSFHVQMGIATESAWYVKADGSLDVPKLLTSFIEFWREHGEVLLRGMPYQEAAPHLVLMAYLQRVVNGGGRIEREFAVGTGRADLVIDFGGQRDILELKLATATQALARGLDQVAAYAQRLGRDAGYLILFDPKATTPWPQRGQLSEQLHQGVKVSVLRA